MEIQDKDTLKQYIVETVSQCDDFDRLHSLKIDCTEAILKSTKGFVVASEFASDAIKGQLKNDYIDKNVLTGITKLLDSQSYLLDLLLNIEHQSTLNLIKCIDKEKNG